MLTTTDQLTLQPMPDNLDSLAFEILQSWQLEQTAELELQTLTIRETLKRGRLVARVKEKSPRGFQKWLQQHFSGPDAPSRRTLLYSLAVYQVFGNTPLKILRQFDPTALFILADRSKRSPRALKTALAQAENGRRITVKHAKSLIFHFKER